MKKYPEFIMRPLRYKKGLKPNDTRLDSYIMSLGEIDVLCDFQEVQAMILRFTKYPRLQSFRYELGSWILERQIDSSAFEMQEEEIEGFQRVS